MQNKKNNYTVPIIAAIAILLLAFKKPNKNTVIVEPLPDLPLEGYDFITLVYKGANFLDKNTLQIVGSHVDKVPLKLSGKDYDLNKNFIIVNFANKEYLVAKIHTSRK